MRGGNNVAHGGLNRCKTQIKERLRGAFRVEEPVLFPQPRGLIPRLPRRKIVCENEGGRAVKRRSDTAETNCPPALSALLLSKMGEIRQREGEREERTPREGDSGCSVSYRTCAVVCPQDGGREGEGAIDL